jgi:hypothetical protein
MEKHQEIHIVYKENPIDKYAQGISFYDCTISEAVKAFENRQKATKLKLHLIGLYPVYNK